MMSDLLFLNKMLEGLNHIRNVPSMDYLYNARHLVFQEGKTKLYHYHPQSKNVAGTPLLIVFATVNRPEIMDLLPDKSFIGGLLKNGMDVYLLDWGYPDSNDREDSLEKYITHYMHACVNFIIREAKQKQINLLGICQGGIISLCYSILFSQIKNLTLISTPIDFSTEDHVVSQLLKQINIENILSPSGNVPGNWLTQFFIGMRPFELLGQKYLHFLDQLQNAEKTEKFLRVEKWLYDAPDQTGTSFQQLITELYQHNKLIKGDFLIGGTPINLASLSIPVLNIMAKEDEIVPISATRVLKKYIETKDYTEKYFASGHIGIYISEKIGNRLSKTIANWFFKRS